MQKENKGKVSILEIGEYHDGPDITRVFDSKEKAIKNIPVGFQRMKEYELKGLYYENKNKEEWLTIKTYKVEG